MKRLPIAVLGAGSWGTALAILLARNGEPTRLWGRDPVRIKAMKEQRQNPYYLPDFQFPENLELYEDLAEVLANVRDILIAMPSYAVRELLTQAKSFISNNAAIIFATKGLDPQKRCLMHELVYEIFSPKFSLAVISGPTFAKEVAQGLPTAITLATHDNDLAQRLIARLHNPTFRPYLSRDIVGVEIGGAVKNVLAIAVGVSDGLGYGSNARSALITRGLAEMVRLGTAMGGAHETFLGLAGVGDLVLTCTDNQSRNRRFGLALGQGLLADQAEKNIGQLVEGIRTTQEIYYLAQKNKINMPITEHVYQILYENFSPADAVSSLLAREVKSEN